VHFREAGSASRRATTDVFELFDEPAIARSVRCNWRRARRAVPSTSAQFHRAFRALGERISSACFVHLASPPLRQPPAAALKGPLAAHSRMHARSDAADRAVRRMAIRPLLALPGVTGCLFRRYRGDCDSQRRKEEKMGNTRLTLTA
jgi:hypothetical protein